MNNTIFIILIFLACILLAVGVYFLGLYLCKLPTQKTGNMVETVSHIDDEHNQTFVNKILGGISKKLLPIIHIDESTKFKMQTALDYAHYNISAEQHYADSLAVAILIGIMSLFLAFINPIFTILGFVFAGLIFKLEFDGPVKRMEKIREDIEFDSALFCKFVADALRDGNRNVVDILSSSKESMSKSFKRELETTITEMKTGSQEDAIINMSKRINTSTVMQIAVGLLGIIKGNDQTLYFDMLYEKLYKNELAAIKKKNSVKPGKISKLSMLLIVAVIGQILVGMILSLLQQLGDSGIL